MWNFKITVVPNEKAKNSMVPNGISLIIIIILKIIEQYLKALPSKEDCSYTYSGVNGRLNEYHEIKHPARPYKNNI